MNDLFTNSKDMKKAILQSIRTLLLELGSSTKVELSQKLGISFPTISKFLSEMETIGEVILSGMDDSSGGRRAKRYRYNPECMLGLAIFLEKNETNYTVFNCLGELKEQGKTASALMEDAPSVTKHIEKIIEKYPKIRSIAIGVPGSVKNGRIIYIHNYEQFRHFDLKGYFEKRFSIPVVVENDMNAAVLGYSNNNKIENNPSLIYLYLGQNGPGAGIIVNGDVIRGNTFFSGEIGFVPQYDDRNFGEALKDRTELDKTNLQKEKEIDSISRMVATFTAMLNPHSIIFNSDEVDESTINQIANRSATYIPDEHLPELTISNWMQDYLYGLQSLGLDLMVSATSIHINEENG
ncbi:ROK family transcriptional regulator [Paenibacillus sp. IHBB 10380]|uniref:ROK family transcriptional regulator n=1 Tax=Paenibacillus sp. IHBB 10380 TaxID=1566358 RepID=UPI0005CFB414|nr:ROK family protein [Paenibacillus sp. IHBB 10380]AJS59925.1 ROK family transcriptional regulator [Paenibacillus sp. IHBB 10380]